MPLSYPQSLWGIQPQALALLSLEATGPIAKAKVTRNLFPPSLTVEVAERLPVAVAQPTAVAGSQELTSKKWDGWMLRGGWMPFDSYTTDCAIAQNSSLEATSSQATQSQHSLPTLKVIGDFWNIYRAEWPKFYQGFNASDGKSVWNRLAKPEQLDFENRRLVLST